MLKNNVFAIAFCLVLVGYQQNAMAQMYESEGRMICCGDSLLTGNAQAIRVNPAFLSQRGKKVSTFGFLQIGFNFHSNQLNFAEVLRFGFSDNVIPELERQDILDRGDDQTAYIWNANLDFTWLSYSVFDPKFGGLSISLRDRINQRSLIPNEFLGVLFFGTNSPAFEELTPDQRLSIGNGTQTQYTHLRELTLSYARSIVKQENFSIDLGATFSKIWGVGYFDSYIDNQRLRGGSSFSAFYDVDYSSVSSSLENISGGLLDTSGGGFLLDLGVDMKVKGLGRFSASILDIGSMNWNDNITVADADFETVLGGVGDGIIQNYSIIENLDRLYDASNHQPGPAFTSPFATKLRLNTLFYLGPSMNISTDFMIPLRSFDNELPMFYNPAFYSGYFNWSPLDGIVNLSAGVFYGAEVNFRIPVGVSIGLTESLFVSLAVNDINTIFLRGIDPFAGVSINFMNIKY
ncbi:DUF5723 family protein [Pararhodonellum marinum]|uniref:DUF5723 family protein n=1 Tax=Pararhodonellum marinum TaxID=2755358 RepID=UPI00188E0470|nr:DUF5723 family protein [Pararhodonellum marinum]